MFRIRNVRKFFFGTLGNYFFSDDDTTARKALKSQVIIRRPIPAAKSHPRTVASKLEDESASHEGNGAPSSEDPHNAVASSSSSSHQPDQSDSLPQDELSRIRALLRPPPIPGVDDWGIPPESTEPCDPAIQVRIAFLTRRLDCNLCFYIL